MKLKINSQEDRRQLAAILADNGYYVKIVTGDKYCPKGKFIIIQEEDRTRTEIKEKKKEYYKDNSKIIIPQPISDLPYSTVSPLPYVTYKGKELLL